MGKQSFVVYDDWGVLVENMPEDGAGELFKALFEYRRTHSMPHVGADVQPVLAFMISQIDKDVERYEKTCERNREKVMKRWSAVNNGMPNDTVAYSGIHPHTENTDKDKDKDKDKDIKRRVKFVPPTVEEVQTYIREKGYTFSADAFVAYYSSQRWKKANGQPLADWHAACVTWEKRQKQDQKRSNWKVEERSYDFDDLERRLMG